MIKKVILLLMSFVLVFAFVSCGKNVKNEESVLIKENEGEYLLNATPLSNEVIFDGNGVVVTLNSIIYDNVITKLSFNIKNNTEDSVKVLVTDLSINSLMSLETMTKGVDAKSETTGYVEISNEWFHNFDIEAIQDIGFVIRILDENSNEIARSNTLKATAEAPKTYIQQYNEDGFRLYDKGNIVFSAGELKKSKYSNDYELMFYVENNTDKGFSILAKDVLVNGVKISPTFVITVGENKKAVDSMLFLEKDLKSLNITEITSVTASFTAKDENSNTVFELLNVNVPIK